MKSNNINNSTCTNKSQQQPPKGRVKASRKVDATGGRRGLNRWVEVPPPGVKK